MRHPITPGKRCSPLPTRPTESIASCSALTQHEVRHKASEAQQQQGQGQPSSLPSHVQAGGSRWPPPGTAPSAPHSPGTEVYRSSLPGRGGASRWVLRCWQRRGDFHPTQMLPGTGAMPSRHQLRRWTQGSHEQREGQATRATTAADQVPSAGDRAVLCLLRGRRQRKKAQGSSQAAWDRPSALPQG